jgi:hypothetical protein
VNDIGIFCILSKTKGNNRKIKGMIRLNRGEEILITDISCKKEEE